mmetsp:Transcript_109957/g.306446  ORF Transcript_109957/g.306446 Transcript_109957/m.306446 type:complete len:249 (+) Transcript_109957:881-1627(+)
MFCQCPHTTRQVFYLLEELIQRMVDSSPRNEPLLCQLHHCLHDSSAFAEAYRHRFTPPLLQLILQNTDFPLLHCALQRRQLSDRLHDVSSDLLLTLDLGFHLRACLSQAALHSSFLLRDLPLTLCSRLGSPPLHLCLLLPHLLLKLLPVVGQLLLHCGLFEFHGVLQVCSLKLQLLRQLFTQLLFLFLVILEHPNPLLLHRLQAGHVLLKNVDHSFCEANFACPCRSCVHLRRDQILQAVVRTLHRVF